ncbi:hypothetical protein H6P81_011650 [Aristolochia fimbriata]|uniref:Protein SDA1 n=1 Tax=Aristolochia fimbriata TaxID=158543 RepID=A0AAV7E9J2_ARIFI|nr:hypothetical protein H6P81_011650 [Aristolochia fimbriata]
MPTANDLWAESLAASGREAEKLSLPALQSKMKCDPDGYEAELRLLYRHFETSLNLFHQQSALNITTTGIGPDPVVSKDLGDMAMFLAHVTPSYPKHLSEFPKQLAALLHSAGRSLPSLLRSRVAQALILLSNRKIVDIEDILALYMELQTVGDRELKKLAFEHVVHSIKRMNQKHKNEVKNRTLQNVIFSMLEENDELKAKRSLVTLCDLHRRRVWFDDRTANAICRACFHESSRIMVAALKFLLGYEQIEEDETDESGSDEEATPQKPQAVLSREAIYKAHHKGTTASKKKKKAKLDRAVRSMKRQQRLSSGNNNPSYYSPLTHLKDAQGFSEKLFSRLQTCNERFEVKMMMLKVIARTVGLHQLVLLNFYPFVQKYCQPHQRDITSILAAAVQTCHEMVPPDAVEPLFRQIVNQFVHDRSRPEAIAVGLNVVREICLRMPSLMNEDLLQDLVLYKKSHEKAVSSAARSLISLFREICPSLLTKKDRGRPTDPKARPKAFGEVKVATDVVGVELLNDYNEAELDDTYSEEDDSKTTEGLYLSPEEELENASEEEQQDDADNEEEEKEVEEEGEEEEVEDEEEEEEGVNEEGKVDNREMTEGLEADFVSNDDDAGDDDDEDDDDDDDGKGGDEEDEEQGDEIIEKEDSGVRKRKFLDQGSQISASGTSLRALKRLAVIKTAHFSSETADRILSNEDFQRIRELKAKKEARIAMAQHGMLKKGSESSVSVKIPSSEQLSMKRVDPSKLEAHIRRKLTKDERLALVKAGREDRGKYQARTAVKQKKTGGLSNRQKEHKKAMPLAAKRAKVSRTHEHKRKQQRRSGKQFRGKKAWK